MWAILVKGGWMMIPLAICSLVAVAVIVNRFFFFRSMKATHRAEDVLEMVQSGHIEEALKIVEEPPPAGRAAPLPVMKVLSAGLTHRFEAAGAMETTGTAELSAMRRGLTVLDTIITLSPLLGLLGTIIGMISSFNIMATTGLGQPHAVTGGVAEALIATASGISVAVIALIPYNYFLSRVEREAEMIESYGTRLEMALNTVNGGCR